MLYFKISDSVMCHHFKLHCVMIPDVKTGIYPDIYVRTEDVKKFCIAGYLGMYWTADIDDDLGFVKTWNLKDLVEGAENPNTEMMCMDDIAAAYFTEHHDYIENLISRYRFTLRNSPAIKVKNEKDHNGKNWKDCPKLKLCDHDLELEECIEYLKWMDGARDGMSSEQLEYYLDRYEDDVEYGYERMDQILKRFLNKIKPAKKLES